MATRTPKKSADAAPPAAAPAPIPPGEAPVAAPPSVVQGGAAAPLSLRRASLHVPKAPEIVADRIRKRIIAGTLKVGELLPAESKLMEEFGVSRPTIREAFRILEAERLITVARGARGGALIHAPDPQLIAAYTLLVLQAERTTVEEIFTTQRLMEPPLAREIALNGAADAPARLQEKLDHERATVNDPVAFNRAVSDFHRCIVDLSGNRPLIHLMEAITRVIEKHQALVAQINQHRQTRESMLAAIEVAFKSQKKLIDLIAKRDGAGAEAHWNRHMDITHKIYVNGFEHRTIHEMLTE